MWREGGRGARKRGRETDKEGGETESKSITDRDLVLAGDDGGTEESIHGALVPIEEIRGVVELH